MTNEEETNNEENVQKITREDVVRKEGESQKQYIDRVSEMAGEQTRQQIRDVLKQQLEEYDIELDDTAWRLLDVGFDLQTQIMSDSGTNEGQTNALLMTAAFKKIVENNAE